MPDPEPLKKAKNQALKYLSYKDRSKWEINQYLEKKKHSHLVIQQTLEYLENLNYVDDQQFALQWGQFNINKKKLGRNRLYLELLNKGIDRKILEESVITRSVVIKPVFFQFIFLYKLISEFVVFPTLLITIVIFSQINWMVI